MKLEIIKDTLGNDYVVINFHNHDTIYESILHCTEQFDNFDLFNLNLLKRNGNKYHITIFNVSECSKNPELLKQELIGVELSNNKILFKGIGSIDKDELNTFFIVVGSYFLNQLRFELELPKNNFHITIGFTEKDLFHESKDKCNVKDFIFC